MAVDTSKQETGVRDNYTHSGIPSFRQMNHIGHEINMLSMSQDLTKTPTGYRYNVEEDTGYHFQVIIDPTDTTTVAIRGGRWDITINGITQVSQGISTSGDFAGISTPGLMNPSIITTSNPVLSADTTYYVYLLWYGSELGEITKASRLDAYISDTRPVESDDDYQATSIKVLAKVVTDINGNIDIDPEWTGGNIKTKAIVFDGKDPISSEGELGSLNYNSAGAVQSRGFELALKGKVAYPSEDAAPKFQEWIYANTVDGNAIDSIDTVAHTFDISESTLVVTWRQAKYDVGTVNGGIDGMSDFSDDGAATKSVSLADIIEDLIGDGTIAVLHSKLEDMITNPEENSNHDGRYEVNFNVEGTVNSGSYRTTGSHEAGAFRLDSTPTNEWAWDEFIVSPTTTGQLRHNTSMTLDFVNRQLDGADWSVNDGTQFKILDTRTSDTPNANSAYTLGGFGAEKGITALKGTGNQAGLFDDGTNSVQIADGTYAVQAIVGDIKLDDGNVNINASDKAYIHDSNTGVTGNGFSGGIMVDEDARESSIVDIVEMYL